jgi:hypothetical protein
LGNSPLFTVDTVFNYGKNWSLLEDQSLNYEFNIFFSLLGAALTMKALILAIFDGASKIHENALHGLK